MAYIDKTYYDNEFKGNEIPDSEFDRLAEIASDIVYDVCRVKPNEDDLVSNDFKKAVAYQVEMLYEQGGVNAIVGFSESSVLGQSESLGDYSISAGAAGNSGSGGNEILTTAGGIPISPATIAVLRRMGLMQRWAYARR